MAGLEEMSRGIAHAVIGQAQPIEELRALVAELERQVGGSSRNSSAPPSSDGLAKLARDLHHNGVIERAVGCPIPVLLHGLEYYEKVAQLPEAANPAGLADEFLAWVREQ